jgi:CBS domain-containing protein
MGAMKTVKQVLDTKGHEIHSLSPEATVYDALHKMAQEGIGALVVLDRGELVGIVSERDYARKVILKDRDSRETLIRTIMTEKVIRVTPDHSVGDCMTLMTGSRIRHLVVEESQRLVGLISIGDIVKAFTEEQQTTIEQLNQYISGSP